jgi:hypothetical protein
MVFNSPYVLVPSNTLNLGDPAVEFEDTSADAIIRYSPASVIVIDVLF